MSAPKLVLLTGPAAGEVYRVLLQGCPLYPAGHPINEKDGHWWDEVRDFLAVPRKLVDEPIGWGEGGPSETWDSEAECLVERICDEPHGTEWLVGLVLPEPVVKDVRMGGNHVYWPWGHRHVERETGRQDPARLAILAPEPPPLLVERVRAWGGEVWECEWRNPELRIGRGPEHAFAGCVISTEDSLWNADTWPEAVRAALGEVAP